MRKIFDCFTFFDELDLLEMRLRYGYPYVDYFVICESNYTFRGNLKKLNFLKHRERFAPYLSKIIYVPFMTYAQNDPWQMEKDQRNAINIGLEGAKDDDLIIISDVDEFINYPNVMYTDYDIAKIRQYTFCYYLNTGNLNYRWNRAGVITNKELKKVGSIDGFRDIIIEDDDYQKMNILEEGGWHFTYVGGIDQIQSKLSNFSHSEFDTPEINNKEYLKSRMENGEDIALRVKRTMGKIDIKSTFPSDLSDIIYQYPHLLKQN